ncbi:cyclase family protein [Piscinibacter sp. XHJ-5]|uniref:cyclase family protein n=1 Tax=Piscinibacter sp. XHJ-5 TaxID=3037797 RepID=UPI002452F1F2|nr:cyclase family protein [Piscinibacter sp. XHJ-5]
MNRFDSATRRSGWAVRAAVFIVTCAALAAPAVQAGERDEHDRSGGPELWNVARKARVIDLSHTWDASSPIASVNPPYAFTLSATHANTRGAFNDGGQLSFTAEIMQWSGQHGAPSIDAIGHIGRDGKLFGGVDAAAATADLSGLGASGVGAHLAIDQFPNELMVNRGVLLDVARMVQGDSTPLPPAFEITARHLEEAAQKQRVKLRPGDTVFIRTGWGAYFSAQPALYAGGSSPGPGLDAAEFLIRHGARVVGDDTLTFEQRPPIATVNGKLQVFPVHMRLIADSGIFIIENLDLEELSAARAYEFTVVTPPLKVRGGTGSALRAFALVRQRD